MVSLSASTCSAIARDGLGVSCTPLSLLPDQDKSAKHDANNILYFLKNNFVEDKITKRYSWKQDDYYQSTNVHVYYLAKITEDVQSYLRSDGACIELESPVYVFGDLHGNYKDLQRFSKMLGMFYNPRSSPAKYIFLGGIK